MVEFSPGNPGTPVEITPGALVELLAGERVVAAARKLLAACVRREIAVRSPNRDTVSNGQPRTTAVFFADRDRHEALDELVDAIDRAADRLARQAVAE